MFSNRPEMNTPEYKIWRYNVFSRDQFCCVKCKLKGKKIEAHHIKRWADRPDLRYIVNNGVTLCEDCHNLVTGREESFEEEFRRIVEQKKTERGIKKYGEKQKKKDDNQNPYRKWRKTNPRLRW
jgi:5-methylcytosine-specific restriction endonuclease McrA